ncbi:MAG: hypothetical protein ABR865_05660 [Terracidiphilus sp.]
MARFKAALLQWGTRLRSTDFTRQRLWTALCLLAAAFLLPPYLLKVGHHPPTGTYIAVMGGLAAIMALVREPPVREKVVWIVLITLLIVAEIKDLYVTDQEQTSTFTKINGDLTKTGQDLDKTLKGLEIERQKLGDIAIGVNSAVTTSQTAVQTATEAINTETGGNSFLYIKAKPFMRNTVELEAVRVGQFPLRDVTAEVMDETKFGKLILALPHLQPGPTEDEQRGTFLHSVREASLFKTQIPGFGGAKSDRGTYPLSDDQKDTLAISFSGFTRDWYEDLCLRAVNYRWSNAIRVLDSFPNPTAKTIFTKIDPDFPKKQDGKPDVCWSEVNPSR